MPRKKSESFLYLQNFVGELLIVSVINDYAQVIIIQEVSIPHNPQLKAGAQCAHRKTLNELPINKKTNKTHHNYHTLDDRTIIQSTARKVDNPETTNYNHVIK